MDHLFPQVHPQKIWLQLSLAQQGHVDHFHLTTDLAHMGSLTFKPGQTCTATITGVESPEKFELSLIGNLIIFIVLNLSYCTANWFLFFNQFKIRFFFLVFNIIC